MKTLRRMSMRRSATISSHQQEQSTRFILGTHVAVRVWLNNKDSCLLTNFTTDKSFNQVMYQLVEERFLFHMLEGDMDRYHFQVDKSPEKRKRRDYMNVMSMSDTITSPMYIPYYRPVLNLILTPQIHHSEFVKIDGVPMEFTANNPVHRSFDFRGMPIPRLLLMCLQFVNEYGIEQEGIFRKSGQKLVMDQWIGKWNLGDYENSVFDSNTYVDSVACVMKQYLRETLPEPLIDYSVSAKIQKLFDKKANNYSHEQKVDVLRRIIHELLDPNYIVLEHLMALCNKIKQRSTVNLMDPKNLATCLAPALFRQKEEMTLSNMDRWMSVSALHSEAMVFMINNYSHLFARNSPYDSNLIGLEQSSNSWDKYPPAQKFDQLTSGTLVVDVLACHNLISADTNGFSDPYVILELNGQKLKTRIVKKSLNPVYYQQFELYVANCNSDELKISVYDYDKMKHDDFIGRVSVPVSVVKYKRRMQPMTLNLQDVKHGTIDIALFALNFGVDEPIEMKPATLDIAVTSVPQAPLPVLAPPPPAPQTVVKTIVPERLITDITEDQSLKRSRLITKQLSERIRFHTKFEAESFPVLDQILNKNIRECSYHGYIDAYLELDPSNAEYKEFSFPYEDYRSQFGNASLSDSISSVVTSTKNRDLIAQHMGSLMNCDYTEILGMYDRFSEYVIGYEGDIDSLFTELKRSDVAVSGVTIEFVSLMKSKWLSVLADEAKMIRDVASPSSLVNNFDLLVYHIALNPEREAFRRIWIVLCEQIDHFIPLQTITNVSTIIDLIQSDRCLTYVLGIVKRMVLLMQLGVNDDIREPVNLSTEFHRTAMLKINKYSLSSLASISSNRDKSDADCVMFFDFLIYTLLRDDPQILLQLVTTEGEVTQLFDSTLQNLLEKETLTTFWRRNSELVNACAVSLKLRLSKSHSTDTPLYKLSQSIYQYQMKTLALMKNVLSESTKLEKSISSSVNAISFVVDLRNILRDYHARAQSLPIHDLIKSKLSNVVLPLQMGRMANNLKQLNPNYKPTDVPIPPNLALMTYSYEKRRVLNWNIKPSVKESVWTIDESLFEEIKINKVELYTLFIKPLYQLVTVDKQYIPRRNGEIWMKEIRQQVNSYEDVSLKLQRIEDEKLNRLNAVIPLNQLFSAIEQIDFSTLKTQLLTRLEKMGPKTIVLNNSEIDIDSLSQILSYIDMYERLEIEETCRAFYVASSQTRVSPSYSQILKGYDQQNSPGRNVPIVIPTGCSIPLYKLACFFKTQITSRLDQYTQYSRQTSYANFYRLTHELSKSDRMSRITNLLIVSQILPSIFRREFIATETIRSIAPQIINSNLLKSLFKNLITMHCLSAKQPIEYCHAFQMNELCSLLETTRGTNDQPLSSFLFHSLLCEYGTELKYEMTRNQQLIQKVLECKKSAKSFDMELTDLLSQAKDIMHELQNEISMLTDQLAAGYPEHLTQTLEVEFKKAQLLKTGLSMFIARCEELRILTTQAAVKFGSKYVKLIQKCLFGDERDTSLPQLVDLLQNLSRGNIVQL